MAMKTGTHDVTTLLAVQDQSVVAYGRDTIIEVVQRDLATHSRLMEEVVASLCEVTTDVQRKYGTSSHGDMMEVDEFGQAPTQRTKVGSNVGFPLKRFEYPLGWTETWMQEHTPADMVKMVIASQTAHRKAVMREIKRAIFGPTNYVFEDHLATTIDINVKRFVNADSTDIPDGPNGETFDGATHTHYDANATLTAAVVLALIDDVVEHGHGSMVKVAINRANESAFKLLSGFTAYSDPRLVYRNTDTPGQTLDLSRLDDRAIGIFGAAEVWVKPWVPANYAFAWAAGDENKPLAFRQKPQAGLQGLRIAAENSDYPLHAQIMEALFGVGAWTRTNGAVLYFASGTYAEPTF